MGKKIKLYITFFILFFLNISVSRAQITSPDASGSAETNYPVFQATDSIFIFCSQNGMTESGNLQVQTLMEGTKTFLWEKYNPETSIFEFYFSESTGNQQSVITGLEDGCYRVTVTQGETSEIYRAWILTDQISGSAKVSDSNCESFILEGSFTTEPMIYYDLSDNTQLELIRDIKVQWKEGQVVIASVLSPQIFNPPFTDTEYTLNIYDQFGCETNSTVLYQSVVTKAEFSVDPQQGEAPLTVNFTNQSQNGDQYEWFFFRDLDEIKKESENTLQPVDSIMLVAYDQNPVYTYENSGIYMVKLVSKHISDTLTCVDTTYLEDYIFVDTSFVAVPNVFTPNNDGTNDMFVVKFWSMKSIKIQIYNRWGKRIHFWESDDIRGFENTYTQTVWDGRLGGRYASPGVYYYVVEGMGRDDQKRKAHGFFHLFRDKKD
jgi:gliding motility-associated-like protein